MANIVTHSYNNFSICQKESNGYVSLTDMAKAGNKKVNDYLRLDTSQEYFNALSIDTGIPVSSLVKVSRGGNTEQGTWTHPDIAIDFAKWCNVHFRIWANRTLVKSFTSLDERDRNSLQEWRALNVKAREARNELKAAKIALIQSRIDEVKAKLLPRPIAFNETITVWADEYLRYEEGLGHYIGMGNVEGTLSNYYTKYCEANGLKALCFQRFSAELIKYLIKGKGWKVHRNRDSGGTRLVNVAFITSKPRPISFEDFFNLRF